MPSAPGSAILTATPWSGRPAASGKRAASSARSAVTPEPASVRPYVGTTGQPAAVARRTRSGGIGAPPRSTARTEGGGAAAVPAEPSASSRRASWMGTSETWLGASGPRRTRRTACGSKPSAIDSGTPSPRARQATPRPATCERARQSSQPVAGGSAADQAAALAPSAACERSAAFGRPVVPEVRTATAGDAGASSTLRRSTPRARSASAAGASAGIPWSAASSARSASWTSKDGLVSASASPTSRRVIRVPSGTAIAPTRRIPATSATASPDGTTRSATRSPVPTPAAWSAAAATSVARSRPPNE